MTGAVRYSPTFAIKEYFNTIGRPIQQVCVGIFTNYWKYIETRVYAGDKKRRGYKTVLRYNAINVNDIVNYACYLNSCKL